MTTTETSGRVRSKDRGGGFSPRRVERELTEFLRWRPSEDPFDAQRWNHGPWVAFADRLLQNGLPTRILRATDASWVYRTLMPDIDAEARKRFPKLRSERVARMVRTLFLVCSLCLAAAALRGEGTVWTLNDRLRKEAVLMGCRDCVEWIERPPEGFDCDTLEGLVHLVEGTYNDKRLEF